MSPSSALEPPQAPRPGPSSIGTTGRAPKAARVLATTPISPPLRRRGRSGAGESSGGGGGGGGPEEARGRSRRRRRIRRGRGSRRSSGSRGSRGGASGGGGSSGGGDSGGDGEAAALERAAAADPAREGGAAAAAERAKAVRSWGRREEMGISDPLPPHSSIYRGEVEAVTPHLSHSAHYHTIWRFLFHGDNAPPTNATNSRKPQRHGQFQKIKLSRPRQIKARNRQTAKAPQPRLWDLASFRG
jgi:hypothetical protein